MEYLNFNGKKYLIFGASSGIGKQVALQLSQLGARLVLVGRNEEKLQEIIKDLIENAETEDECERLSQLIEYKPTINTNLLEDMIYHGEIDQESILPAVVVTTTEGIRFGKAKI